MHRSTRCALTAGATLALAPAAASAAPANVYAGATSWSIPNVYDTASPANTNRTWLGYITAPFTNGTASGAGSVLLGGPDGLGLTTIDGTVPKGADRPYDFTFPLAAAGTVDVAAKMLDVTGTGTVRFETHGSTVALTNPRVVLNGAAGTVTFSGGTTDPAGATTPYDASTPLFTLDASGASFRQIGSGLVQISGLAPTVAKGEVFGGAYAPGVAGPNRTPNTFGSFSVVVDTTLPAAPVERIVERVTEQSSTATVTEPVIRIKQRLTHRAFRTSSALDIAIRRSGSREIIGEGYVRGTRLVVWAPKGTTLEGKYVLRRLSGSKRLPKSTTVVLGAAKAAKQAR